MKKSTKKTNAPTSIAITQPKEETFFNKAGGGSFFNGAKQTDADITDWLDKNSGNVSSPFINNDVLVARIRKELAVPHSDDYIKEQIILWKEKAAFNESKLRPKEHFYFIHGTGSTPKVWKEYDGKIINMMSETFGSEKKMDVVHTESWKGDNNSDARKLAIEDFSEKIVAYHKIRAGEPIVLVGHSHGGNIALEVANKISYQLPDNSIRLITLNTPVRPDYQPKYNDNVKHFNFYIGNDDVQTEQGGYNRTGKIYDPDSGTARKKPGRSPKGTIKGKAIYFMVTHLTRLFGEMLNVEITIDPKLMGNFGGESGTAGNQFKGAVVDIEVKSPIPEGKENILNLKLRHRLWHIKNLPELEKALQTIDVQSE